MLVSESLALAVIGLSSAVAGSITGDDFEFSVSYIDYLDIKGPKFSTKEPPKDPISAETMLLEQPIITVKRSGSEKAASNDDKFISFLEITQVSSAADRETTPTVNYFPWIKANQTMAPDGSLVIDLIWSNYTHLLTNEIHNASMQVWKQTASVLQYLQNKSAGTPVSLLDIIFEDGSDSPGGPALPPLDFPRASIAFTVRNETGLCRNDVDSNGEPVSVSSAVTTSCAAATSTPAATTTVSPSASVATTPAGSATSGTPSPTQTPGSAASLSAAAGWAMLPLFAFFLL